MSMRMSSLNSVVFPGVYFLVGPESEDGHLTTTEMHLAEALNKNWAIFFFIFLPRHKLSFILGLSYSLPVSEVDFSQF